MKSTFIPVTCLVSTLLHADPTTFSQDRLTAFYDIFFCEEKQELADVGLTTSCSSQVPINPFVPPPDPSPPPFITGLLPVVIVNNSGLPDSAVHVLFTGVSVSGNNQVWGKIDTATGVATLQNVALSDNSTSFTVQLTQLPSTSDGYVFYMPQVQSGLIWFSMDNALSMGVVDVGGTPPLQIVQPNFTNSLDTNYSTNYDIFELTYLLSGSPQIAADATAVSFFSIPLYGYLAGATSASSNTGLYQPRSYILSQAIATLNTAPQPERTQWTKLPLTQSGQILRLVSTGKAMAASIFDANYLDNTTSYGYSYIQDIWSGGASSYYNQNVLNMTVTVTNPSTATYNYQGQVDLANNTFIFNSTDGGPQVIFPAPTTSPTPTGTDSYKIFSAINFITPTPVAGTAADAVSKLVQEAIIAGLVPTTDTLSLNYLSSNQSNFYKVNSNLKPAGQGIGPWYDLYSKSLHALGSIYTFGFDEPLWPQVLLGAPFTDGFTYLGITIGNVTD